MSSLIYQYNSRNQTTYVYESESYWDKEKKQPRSRRKLIGKLDPSTGNIVPTGGRGRKPKAKNAGSDIPHETAAVPLSKPSVSDSESDYKKLYEECLSKLTDSEARISSLEETIRKLSVKNNRIHTRLAEVLRLTEE